MNQILFLNNVNNSTSELAARQKTVFNQDDDVFDERPSRLKRAAQMMLDVDDSVKFARSSGKDIQILENEIKQDSEMSRKYKTRSVN